MQTHTAKNEAKIRLGRLQVSARLQKRDRLGMPGRRRDRASEVSLETVIAGVALERTRAKEALEILTGRLLKAQEEERRRIARDLHDGLNQQLAVLAIELGILARQVPKEAAVILEQLSHLRDLTETLSNDLRHVTHQLHPAMLEHLGLILALHSYCTEFSQHEGIQTWFMAEPELGPFPPDVAVCLYRITQEALRNVAKHSGAKEAWVKIISAQNGIQLSIVDKGMGFRFGAPEGTGLGLVSMQERVQLVKGQLIIRTSPSEGTRIEIHVPISWKEQRS